MLLAVFTTGHLAVSLLSTLSTSSPAIVAALFASVRTPAHVCFEFIRITRYNICYKNIISILIRVSPYLPCCTGGVSGGGGCCHCDVVMVMAVRWKRKRRRR